MAGATGAATILGIVALVTCMPCCGGDGPLLVPADTSPTVRRSAQLQVAGRDVRVELAYTPAARSRGLQGRTSLEPDEGMLFLFTESEVRKFWMRDTLIPLDIIFLDEEGLVINVAHGRPAVEKPLCISRSPARFVLEMTDGWSEEHGLLPGQRIEIAEELRSLAVSDGSGR